MIAISRWRRFLVLGALSGSGCTGFGGPGEANKTSSNNDASESLAASRVVESTPFPASELWILGSDTTTGRPNLAYVSMSGVGELLFGLEVTTNVLTGAGCSMQSVFPTGVPIDPDEPTDERAVSFSFDGQTMRVSADGLDTVSGEPCSIAFAAKVAQLGAVQVLFGFNAFDVTVQGQPTVNGQPVTFAPLQLNRVRQSLPIACDDPTTSLEGLTWSISNMDLSSIPVPPVSQDESESINLNIYGDSNQVFDLGLAVGFEGASCFGGTGTISFDGRTLIIEAESGDTAFPERPPDFDDDLPIPDDEEPRIPHGFDFITEIYEDDPSCNISCIFSGNGECDDGRAGAVTAYCAPGTDCGDCGPAGMTDAPPASIARLIGPKRAPNRQVRPGDPGGICTISFTGTVAECGIFLPPILVGGGASATESIRIEGTGRYTTPDGKTGEVNTLYLRPQRGFGGGCGLGMITMLPFMTLGMLGFRYRSRRAGC